jgi:pimeloyl-ACP methyl ester carboxylesterase
MEKTRHNGEKIRGTYLFPVIARLLCIAMKTGQTIARDGTTITYDRLGNGPPVILIVGALCTRTLGPAVQLAPLLADGLSVFTYDRRGRGGSGDHSPYAIEREIEDLDAVIREAGGSAFVFGHSSGATLALLAAAHGLPIRKLALYEAPFIVDQSRSPIGGEWQRIAAYVAEGREDDALKLFLKMVGVPAFAVAVMRWLPVWRKIRAVAHTLPYDGALTQPFQRGEPLPASAWASVTAPALAIAGAKSPTWLQHGSQALARALPNAQFRSLAGQTHDVAARALAPVLNAFFSE